MKTSLFSVFALALLLAAGCQREIPAGTPADGTAVDVTFNLSLQGIRTKAFSDGSQAKDLSILVYAIRTDGPLYLEAVSKDVTGAFANSLTAEATLKLVRGETYSIVFLASSPNCKDFTVDKENATLTVGDGPANNEQRDAFYGLWSQKVEADGNHEYSVELKRPFAQINVLTTKEDYDTLGDNEIAIAGSAFTLKVPTVLHFLTGVADTEETQTLGLNAMSSTTVDIPAYKDSYVYVGMNYVLAGDRTTTDLKMDVYRNQNDCLFSLDIPNVPYQCNWRTIILGDIFCVDGKFSVTIVPDYLDDAELKLD